MKKITLALLLMLISATALQAQQKLTENTFSIKKGTKGVTADPEVMSWLVGSWNGTGLGGDVRETWEKTGTGDMMGMFVMSKEGKPNFYEFILITKQDDELVVKLKHFTPELVGWEEKEKSVVFRFIKQEGRRYLFNGITFENVSEKKLMIFVALRQKDGTVKEAEFEFDRIR